METVLSHLKQQQQQQQKITQFYPHIISKIDFIGLLGTNVYSGRVAIHVTQYTLFFYKNLFYKNVEAEIDPNFKNVLRTFLRLRVD